MGEPNRSTPPSEVDKRHISGGNSGNDWSPEDQKISHLDRLRWRPKVGPNLTNTIIIIRVIIILHILIIIKTKWL